jgi:hypothetical protein
MTVAIDILCIAVLRALPRVLFCAVVAHEVGHAWLRANGIDGLSLFEEEGFCEFLAFTWLREETSTERDFYAERIANNEDSVYGNGFRHLHSLSDVYGFQGLTDSLRRSKCLPSRQGPC